jgi:asparagine synthase (glutamine-hydrolysing)
MCGIAGIVNFSNTKVHRIEKKLEVMNFLLKHRGPDGNGVWTNELQSIGLAHQRLSIIDLTDAASQPMKTENGNCIVYNGEIYNYKELHEIYKNNWSFKSKSDTECILAAYAKFGNECLDYFRGMFAFAIWDETKQLLFCARDRFGIKPFYYTIVDEVFYFASEAKALLPFLPEIKTNPSALSEYLTFQYTIGEKTLFEGIEQLLPGHYLTIENSEISIKRYWDVNYEIDYNHTEKYFKEKLEYLVDDSLKLHLRSDVPVGCYVSGGVDSSLIHLLATEKNPDNNLAFHGRFNEYKGYDESRYAQSATDKSKGKLFIADIIADDFKENIRNVIYHLDFPVAGPGSFPQYMVSKLAASKLKVVLGGQGGDEVFGGYARYLIAYFEQCINSAIDGTHKNGNYVVTIESIIPNLTLLQEYKPMMKEFWKKGLFDSLDERYFRLVDRSTEMSKEIFWDQLDFNTVINDFKKIFNNESNVRKEAYFDKMTHFDFKCLLPALLQVEDRMSMAHGIESRVPLLDHVLIEFAATIPADIKFKNGTLKNLLKSTYSNVLPKEIVNRRDKMGFPVPLKEWFANELKEFVNEVFSNVNTSNRDFINTKEVLSNFGNEGQFSRKTWGLLSLEIWHQLFHDNADYYKNLLND